MHGYSFQFHLYTNTKAQSIAWCRVHAVSRALQSNPTAVLFLDQDTYIRTSLPLTIHHLTRLGRDRLIALDEGDNEWPGIYPRVALPINRGMSIPELQAGFDTHPAWADALFSGDILNSGGGWLELGHPSSKHTTQSFLGNWWSLGQRWDGGKFLSSSFSFEQRILSVLMGLRQDIRNSTAILEDTTYNSPRSACVRHLYAGNKQNIKYVNALAETMRHRVGPFLGRLNMQVVSCEGACYSGIPTTLFNHSMFGATGA